MILYDLSTCGITDAKFFCADENISFSWKLSGEDGTRQIAYRIRVATDSEALSKTPDLWDSGKIETRRCWHIAYKGKPLPSFARIFWEVEVFGANGSAIAKSQFVTGRIGEEWPSEWFEAPREFDRYPLFRRKFEIKQGWTSARIYVCGLGAFELQLNGKNVSSNELEPGWTNFDKTVPYVAYDINDALRAGDNCLGIMLGGGMYSISRDESRFAYSRHSFGAPKATVYLIAEYPNGETITVSGVQGWFAAPGPLTFSCIYGGEDHDARLAITGLSESDFVQDGRFVPVNKCTPPKGEMRCRQNPPVVVRRRLTPVTSHTLSPDTTIYDFGRNFAGWAKIIAKGQPGQTIRLYFAELLTPEGDLLPVSPAMKDKYYHEYTFAGFEDESWRPRFSFFGFRYVKVVTEARLIDVEGEDIFSDMPLGGSFRCSNNLWNRIHDIILRAIESNAKSVFTDCPHREKLGWLEQLQLIGPGILNNFDAVPMLRKCLADMREAQLDNGMMPTTAPEYKIFDWMPAFRHSPEWGSSSILLVKLLYDACGDETLISENYDMMRRYADYLVSQSDHMILRHGLGDWDDVDCKPSLSVHTPIPVTGTCTLYQDLRVVSWAAEMLEKDADAMKYHALSEEVKHEYNKEFFIPKIAQYATGSQTALSMPLVFDMVENEYVDKVLENLIKDIRQRGNHLTGGNNGHKYLFEALGKYGRSDVVADMLIRRDYPSYGYHIENGATALPEQWSGSHKEAPHGSHNHFMMGGIDAWFYQYLAGIQTTVKGDSIIARIAPQVVHSVEWVDASLETVTGTIRSRWQVDGDNVQYIFDIPAGLEAEIIIHGQAPAKVIGQTTIAVVGVNPGIAK